jgi:hypothetical protein
LARADLNPLSRNEAEKTQRLAWVTIGAASATKSLKSGFEL